MKASILSQNWYESRTVLKVGRWDGPCYKTKGIAHPLWIFEGICSVLNLTNKEWLVKPDYIKEWR